MRALMEIGVVILMLSDSRSQRRDILLGFFLAVSLVLGFVSQLTSQRFYPNATFKFQISSPSMLWWYASSGVAVVTAWITYRLMERGFRPSLLPVAVMMVLSAFHSMMFEFPSGWYWLVARLAATGVIWLALRHSRFGVENWSEFQQKQEGLPA